MARDRFGPAEVTAAEAHPRPVVRALVGAVGDAFAVRPPRDDATVPSRDGHGPRT